jgi:hypothetical protein
VGKRQRDEHALIAAAYGHLLVPLRPPAPAWPTVVDLADLDALARLASQHGRMILRVTDGLAYSYVVEGDGVAYRYRPDAPAPLPAPLAPSQAAWS